MSPIRRKAGLGAAFGGLLVYGWLSWQVYASQRSVDDYTGSWTTGPPAVALNRAAERHLGTGLTSLGDLDQPIAERLASYRHALGAAEGLLVKSLRTRPPQAQVLARLAATRWELEQPRSDEAVARHLAMIEVASKMAPAVPRVQFDLGKLLLEMGRRDDAGRVFARTLELDPARSDEVVDLLGKRRFSADEMLDRLPGSADLLVALAPVFRSEGRTDAYRDLLDRKMDPDHLDSLVAFGAACLATDNAAGLIDRLNAVGPRASIETEAARLVQLSLGYLARSQPQEALEAARRARTLLPGSGAMAEHHGDIAHRAQDTEVAREAYRDALALWAREAGKPVRRARVYLKIGRTHETDRRADLAYDAFKMALRLNTNERYARRRIAEMEEAAGVGRKSGGSGR